MAQNKKSVWSLIILICTIVTLVLLVSSIVVTVVGLPAALEAAKQTASESGASQADIEIAVAIALGTVIAVLVIASIFDVFKIIGGLLFSLKGKWGIFCIVVAILSIVAGAWDLINDITNHAGGASIALAAIGLAVSLLFGFACVKHFQENRA